MCFRCSHIVALWDKYWAKETEKCDAKKRQVSILTTMISCFGATYFWSSILNLLYTILQYISPLLVQLLIG